MKFEVEQEGMVIKEISEKEIKEIHILCDGFSITDSQAPQMSEEFMLDITQGMLRFETLIQFSKWCNTSVRYAKPQRQAREISYYMFDSLVQGYVISKM